MKDTIKIPNKKHIAKFLSQPDNEKLHPMIKAAFKDGALWFRDECLKRKK